MKAKSLFFCMFVYCFFASSCGSDPLIGSEMFQLYLETEGNGTVTGAGIYPAYETVNLTAKPDSINNYKFSGWYMNSTLLSNKRNFSVTMDKPKTIKAVFKK